ncbi:hypothetical protein GCM10011571_07140 [Marinithermofilum abyssi]|uniref:Rubrerythrin diiron-binding domain-containing protein n=1 Tax=Marinithermofilum abyssi TaxID=1571185 RepID=A0A8J2VFF4_9BACL|nr:ferritin-like domain-containing protein [Marinithermofilum abyssi]GGE08418.1 hypothetical protein GCM10011571_07140 [Marinithermofilum abyssi]
MFISQYYTYPYRQRPGIYPNQQDQALINDIAKAVNGEYQAVVCYEQLALKAPTPAEKARIQEIRQDEVRHFQMFSQIYMRLTGRQPSVHVQACPRTYKEGLDAFVRDELETVDFYLDIADKATDPLIKEAFRRAALDEQNHAGWFQYYLSKAK